MTDFLHDRDSVFRIIADTIRFSYENGDMKGMDAFFIDNLPDNFSAMTLIFEEKPDIFISMSSVDDMITRFGFDFACFHGTCGFYHERNHAYCELADRSSKDYSFARCFSKIANYTNEDAYQRNYYLNINEFDAETEGIRFGWKFLKDVEGFGKNADQLALQYLNTCWSKGPYFGNPDDGLAKRPYFQDLDGAFSFFRHARSDCFIRNHVYFSEEKGTSDDTLNRIFDADSRWDGLRERMNAMPGRSADQAAACIMSHAIHKLKRHYPAYREMNTSPMRVLGEPFPVSVSRMREAADLSVLEPGVLWKEDYVGSVLRQASDMESRGLEAESQFEK